MWLQLLQIWLGLLGKSRSPSLSNQINATNAAFLLSPAGLLFLIWVIRNWSDRTAGLRCGSDRLLNGICSQTLFRLRCFFKASFWLIASALTGLTAKSLLPELQSLGRIKGDLLCLLVFLLPALLFVLKSSMVAASLVQAYTHPEETWVPKLVWEIFESIIPDFVPSAVSENPKLGVC